MHLRSKSGNSIEKCNSNAFLLKIDQEIAKNLGNKPAKYLQRIMVNSRYICISVPNSIEKCNSDAFLLKIDQGIAKYLENKPKKIYKGLW